MGRLAAMKVAVVGASGTGSLVAELLMRAGCKDILVIDDDVVELRNLNRILYASQRAAQRREPKVDLLKEGIEQMGLGCGVEPLNGSVLDRIVIARLREADVIFGCVDKAFPRALLCDFAFRYLRPYIDVGTEIGADDQGIVSLDARTSYVAPGRYCLVCSGVVTSRQLAFESLSYEERQRKIAQGYSDDLLLKQPAVMDLNMRSASFGVIVLRHLLQPFLLPPLPVAIKENLVTYTTLPVMQPASPSDTSKMCQVNRGVGYGDNAPPIGLERSAVERILGPKDGAAA
jgi:hypothetical protein